MKILFLNPKINAKHDISISLLRKGVAFLFSDNSDEALQMLEFHSDTIDLAIIHRESAAGNDDKGLRFVEKVKLNSLYKDLPVILTTEVWSDADCAEHQSGPAGVNAYLHAPFSEKELVALCEAVLGQPLVNKEVSTNAPKPGASPLPALEDTFDVFKKVELPGSSSGFSIHLENFAIEGAASGGFGLNLSEEAPALVLTGNSNSEISSSQSQSQDVQQADAGFEISAAPEMSGGSLEVSGPSQASMEADTAEVDIALLSSSKLGDAPEQPEKVNEASIELLGGESKAGEENLEARAIELPSLESFSPESFNSESSSLESGLESSLESEHVPDSELAVDSQVAEEMPYLAQGYSKKSRPAFDPSLIFSEPLGDAIIPGGAAQAPDIETFKKYLMLREQDVAVLSNQLKAAHDQLTASEQSLKEERTKQGELTYLATEQEKKIEDFEKEKNEILERLRVEVEDLVFQLKVKTDKSRILEKKVRETVEEMEHLKVRVRTDIRKIRMREKELENRLEMSKKDSEALIVARENKIIELKRKLDVLEFNMDLLQDQYSREKESSSQLRERLVKAAQVIRVAGGLLDSTQEASDARTEDSSEMSLDNKTLKDEDLKAS